MSDQISSIKALVADAIVLLFGDAGRAKELNADSKVTAMIRTAVTRSAPYALQSIAFQTALEGAGDESLAKLYDADEEATCIGVLPAFMVLATNFVKDEAERRFQKNIEIDKY